MVSHKANFSLLLEFIFLFDKVLIGKCNEQLVSVKYSIWENSNYAIAINNLISDFLPLEYKNAFTNFNFEFLRYSRQITASQINLVVRITG